MEQLYSTQIIDETTDTIYGIEPPSRSHITDKLNELIEKLEASQYKSGYLISKFGRMKL